MDLPPTDSYVVQSYPQQDPDYSIMPMTLRRLM
jgi:hypothetical protein